MDKAKSYVLPENVRYYLKCTQRKLTNNPLITDVHSLKRITSAYALNVNISAPAKVAVTPLSTTEIQVKIASSPLSPNVSLYRASVGGNSCQVPSFGSAPFACNINRLAAGTLHTVNAVACLATGDCSSVTSGEGFTFPDGRSIFHLYTLHS